MDYNSAQNLPLLFFAQAERLAAEPFLWRKQEEQWLSQSWREASKAVKVLSRGLRALGVSGGDRVGLVSENRPEWLIADLAIMSAGAVTVPAYTTNTVDDHAHILQDSGAKVVIVSNANLAERVIPAAKIAGVNTVVTIDELDSSSARGVQVLSLRAVQDRASDVPDDVETEAGKSHRGDPACIIYTSGTGGLPKGVVLSHGAIICNCMGADELLKSLPGYGEDTEVFLSFLPLVALLRAHSGSVLSAFDWRTDLLRRRCRTTRTEHGGGSADDNDGRATPLRNDSFEDRTWYRTSWRAAREDVQFGVGIRPAQV